MKRIGFIDRSLDSYHANTFSGLLRDELRDAGWELACCWGVEQEASRAWTQAHGASWRAIEDMGDCDALMILAPSDPELHLPLAERAFPLGKPVYVDKTFAPDRQTAERIFALADRHGVPVMTSSALRYSDAIHRHLAQVGAASLRSMTAIGGGRSFGEYAIHPVEMVVSAMGPEVEEVRYWAHGKHHQIRLGYSRGRFANVFLHLGAAKSYGATIVTDDGVSSIDCSADPIFAGLLRAILSFFDSGREPIDRRETLLIHEILDSCRER